MSPCLKQCFAYCSIFSDDSKLAFTPLISVWMALGLLHSPNGDMESEEIGELQVRELIARSFLQYEDVEDILDIIEVFCFHLSVEYKMHDLIHELACSVTNPESCIVKSNKDVVSNRVKHLRINLNEDNLPSVWNSKRLWSLFVDPTSKFDITMSFLATCIKRLRYLRVFDLESSYFEVLPSSIGTLQHLRYLSLSGNLNIERLPESICDLQSLQTLLLGGCEDLEELPRGIRKLVSLRTLTVTTKQEYFPENGIGRLKSLRTLVITECENLRSLPEDINYCTTMRTLFLSSCGELGFECKSGEAIIELSLKNLYLLELPKMRGFPHWLQGASKTLQSLLLGGGCDNLVELPNWLSKFISLNWLCIGGCDKLVALPDGMHNLASLTILDIGDCEQLNLECKLENVSPLALQKMIVSDLPQARALPIWLKGASNILKYLKIEDCPALAELPDWLPNLLSLEELMINDCGELLVLPRDMRCLTSLRSFKIKDCNQLELASEPNEVLQMSLQSFYIRNLPQTTALPQWLQGANRTLKTLRIKYCPMLGSLPEWLEAFTSLEKLVIKSCPGLSCLPEGMPRLASLTHLEVESPSIAFYGRYQPEIGTDWGAISHIPNIRIKKPRSDSE